MADMLATGAAWLNEIRAASLSQTVTFKRGSDEVELQATLGQTRYEIETNAGAVTEAIATDFIVAAADLVLSESAVLPQSGDRIETESETFEVLDLGGTGFYRRCDPAGVMIRIHAKKVAPEVEEG